MPTLSMPTLSQHDAVFLLRFAEPEDPADAPDNAFSSEFLETPTVAAVNGHAFGAGAMLTLCHDHRVMRSDRGYWSLPEAALGMPFPTGMNALVTRRLGDFAASTAMLTARRYSAADAVAAGIVHETADADAVRERAVAAAAELAPLRGANYAGIRAGLLADVLPHLDEPVVRV